MFSAMNVRLAADGSEGSAAVAEAPVATPKKRVAKKKAAKSTKKSSKKKGAKKSKKVGKKGPRQPREGLTKRETAILGVLARNSHGLNRAQLKEKTGMQGGLSKVLGAATKDGSGAGGKESLEGQGFIKAEKLEGEPLTYKITASGKAAFEKSKK